MTLYDTLADASRVWIYQAQSPVSEAIAVEIQQHIEHFSKQWTSHNQALRATGMLLHKQFIVLMVDESQAGASGCSIDKSVHFIQALEGKYGINLFDRMSFTYKIGNEIHTAPRDTFAQLYADGVINDTTPVFDNLITTKGAFETSWIKPLGESWHKRMV